MLIFFDKTEAGYAYERYAYKKKHVTLPEQIILTMLREELFVLQVKLSPKDYKYSSCQVACQNQNCYIVAIYCPLNHSYNIFEDFLFDLEKLLNQIKQLTQAII